MKRPDRFESIVSICYVSADIDTQQLSSIHLDHGHHSSSALAALTELVAFDDAIETAVNMTSEDETLIVVTADHSHVFTIGGYSERGNDILGKLETISVVALATSI